MCDQCEVLNINGVNCHEAGCPNAWRDRKPKCKWCGQPFEPENPHQVCCCHSCHVAHSGWTSWLTSAGG